MLARRTRKSSQYGRERTKLNALVLDDQKFDRMRISKFAQKSGLPLKIIEAPSLTVMENELKREAFDLFFIDYQLTDGNGLDAVDLIRQNAANKDAAMIMITGQEKVDVAVSAFRQGCHDLITKDELTADLLHDRMQNALQRVRPNGARDLFQEERFQRQVQTALRESLASEAMQAMMVDGMNRAVRSSGMGAGLVDDRKVESFLLDFLRKDDFDFN